MTQINETIRPSADLRNHYNEVSKLCHENGQEVIITVNGRGDTVLIGYEEYKRQKARLQLLEILAEAEDDVRTGRTAPMKDSFDELRKRLSEK
ncbi:MAG: type II toxin-antitoxin system Phd/YefM family antitoxin [Solobacterium sp.]|nr:type II toxin-antitoxin system Phd/YefM family antitoxin [Solobacterium sp.]